MAPDPALLRLSFGLIAALSRVAPAWRRDDWRDEWLAELHFSAGRLAAHGRLTPTAQLRLMARAAGAALHVLWLWKHEWGLDVLTQDLRYGLRILGRRPGFAAVAILTLALGIGATTAIFSAVRTVLLEPLPYPEPDRLVRVNSLDMRTHDAKLGNLSVPDAADIQRLVHSLDALGAYNAGYFTLTGVGEPERVARMLVTSGYFRVLDARPALGRLFRADEDHPNPPSTVVIADGFWRRRFGADPAIVGRVVTLSGGPATIVGVLEPGFVHPEGTTDSAPEIFALLDPDETTSPRSGQYVHAVARLKAGYSIAQATAETQALAGTLASQYPASSTGRSFVLTPLSSVLTADARTPLIVLQAATFAILLIACANLANLLLGTGTRRAAEFAVRTALGASRRRVVRQLLTESSLLACIGGGLGALLAMAGTSYLSTMAAPLLRPQQRIAIDGPVLLVALSLSVVAGLTFGLLPALQLSQSAAARSLRESRRQTDTPDRGRLRSALIVAEVALSVTLLVGAALLIRSFRQLTHVDPGFASSGVISFQLAIQPAEYQGNDPSRFYDRLYTALEALPGVASVGGVNILPLSGNYSCDGIQIEGREVPNAQTPCAEARSANPSYFRTLGIPLLRGRLFTAADGATATRVVVIGETFARRFFPGEDPVGRRMIYAARRQNDPRLIVGVVGDVRHFGLDQTAPAEFYTPEAQPPSYGGMTIVMQAAGASETVMPPVRAVVRAMAPNAPLYNVRTMEQLVHTSVAAPRFRTLLLALFAGLALLLTVVGTYGVISLVVSQRTQEMGIRLALGATRGEIVGLVVGRGLQPLVLGTVLGLAGGLAVSRAITSLLFDVTPADPATFGFAALVILVSGVLATWIPARRACRVDPARALRAQ